MKEVISKNKAIEILKAKSLKATPQRVELINNLDGNRHLSIYEIYENMKNRFPSISMATVYKIIDIFLSKGIVEEIHISTEKKRYELKKNPHSHHICKKCGKLSDIYLDASGLYQQMEIKGYLTDRCEIYFYGICPECARGLSIKD